MKPDVLTLPQRFSSTPQRACAICHFGNSSVEMIKASTLEQRELDKKLAELQALENEFADCDLELATLRAELAVFEKRYLSLLGPLYAELDEVEAQIAEATARSHSAQQAAEAARAHADQSLRVAEDSAYLAERPEFYASPTLKQLFREAAKAMHPDNDEDRIR